IDPELRCIDLNDARRWVEPQRKSTLGEIERQVTFHPIDECWARGCARRKHERCLIPVGIESSTKAESALFVRHDDDLRGVGGACYTHAPRRWTSPRRSAFDGWVGGPIAPVGCSEPLRDTSIVRVGFPRDANRHRLERKWLAGVIGERARKDQVAYPRC